MYVFFLFDLLLTHDRRGKFCSRKIKTFFFLFFFIYIYNIVYTRFNDKEIRLCEDEEKNKRSICLWQAHSVMTLFYRETIFCSLDSVCTHTLVILTRIEKVLYHMVYASLLQKKLCFSYHYHPQNISYVYSNSEKVSIPQACLQLTLVSWFDIYRTIKHYFYNNY